TPIGPLASEGLDGVKPRGRPGRVEAEDNTQRLGNVEEEVDTRRRCRGGINDRWRRIVAIRRIPMPAVFLPFPPVSLAFHLSFPLIRPALLVPWVPPDLLADRRPKSDPADDRSADEH